MNLLEWIRIVLIGIIEGITEWLPISSTGHMLLFDELFTTQAPKVFTEQFSEMFMVVIQLGAILAVVTLYFNKLNPWAKSKSVQQKKNTYSLWGKVIVGCLPAAVFGLLFDDWMEAHFGDHVTIAVMLILYGVLFILLEYRNRNREFSIQRFSQMTYKTALIIGLIQILSLVPGTSRSGVTILGAMLIGCSRYIAAEYTFYLAIPVMFGASGLKVVKYLLKGNSFTGEQVLVMAVAMVIAYAVSVLAIKFLVGYIKKHDFTVFGYYRIALGILVLVCFGLFL
ncbi:undecaprenyl-diphosphate phosphatase [Cuneatibacter caecimuris]|uniref:Undecaprenyl-diphosphatase n=1 Tax=Cuneatibacter caecimuris TaxID=1796618 RepID=A0A4Q7PP81_9FIRM|nr:undecaprenyl-diphosphate phosphatase [Cuneatibacter caecimuris]RZT00952.1 undecaprenyl-diphosphatase [Cuneatibacter caecimuris]